MTHANRRYTEVPNRKPVSAFQIEGERNRSMRLLRLLTIVLFLLTVASTSAYAAEQRRPNFLLIYTDDQRFDAMGVVQREQGDAGRFPWLNTPNHDRLAAGGVRFRNAFVINSLCAPSRANFLTGRYSHLNGVANNHTPFPADSVTFATELRKVGYTAGYFGKWHMGSQSGQRPGFDYSASFVGQGRYFDCPIEVNGKSTPSTGWVDDVTTDYARDWIRQHRDKPFVAVMGFKSSHGPWSPPERRKNDLADAVSKPPQNADARPPYLGDKPAAPAGKKAAAPAGKNGGKQPVNTDRTEMQRNYFRTLLAVDDNLGRILDLLDELKLADDTVVVFTSDNGYYLGDHGLGDKRSAYDESLRIPMLVRYPRLIKPGATHDAMVLNIDVAPTFLELAGVQTPASVQGRSFVPLLAGQTPADWRKAWFYEYFFERGFSHPTILAVRTETHKLIRYPGHDDWTELFDLKADPYEKKNLFNDPASAELRKQMEAEFDRQAKAVDFQVPAYADERAGAAVPPPGNAAAGVAGNRYVLQYDFTAAKPGALARVADASRNGNDGSAQGVEIVDGRDGKKAARFAGKSSIDIAKSPSLNPAQSPLSVEVVCRPDEAKGVLFASGGQTNGYALLLDDGRPTFVVASDNVVTRARAEKPIAAGQWSRLKAVVGDDLSISLHVDGEKVASAKLRALIGREPNDAMQVGIDARSPVTTSPAPVGFSGLVESVAVFRGVEPAAKP
jgi:arylsulfatase A-like enzyme